MELKTPKVIEKPWGREVWLAVSDKYAGKIIEINRGERTSLQYHKVKHETIYLRDGLLRIELEDKKQVTLSPGDAIILEPGDIHRLEALEDVRIIEISTPELDDVVRIEDDYGR